MIILDSTSKSLEVTTTTSVSLDYYCSFVDITTTTFVPGQSDGNIASATTTTIVAAPASSTQRQIKYISLTNKGTTAQGVTVKFDVSATERNITPSISLSAGETYQYTQDGGWQVLTSNGQLKTKPVDQSGYSGKNVAFYKVGTAAEAVGLRYCYAKDTGFPGAWAPGTPGLAGRATDGTTASDVGCIPIANPSSGANYLVDVVTCQSVAGMTELIDVLWVNSGTVVTTTTAQTINSVTLPARDLNGSTNGECVQAGILVTTATTNAGAVTNTTLTYTNQAGTGSRTATISSFPATAVIGTFVPFQLAAGDTGIRSIQSVTLGTSYGGGAISLVMFRNICHSSNPVVNVGSISTNLPYNPGIRLYNGTCLLPVNLASATTAASLSGSITIMER